MIKLFEQFNNEQEIIDICTKYNIKKYTINSDGSIDVNGGVYLNNKGLTEIPLKFNRVSGDFDCEDNQLTSLIGSPSYVGGYFDCEDNQLTSLIGSPSYVGGSFSCGNNQLTSLKGSPIIIGGYSHFCNNPICVVDTSVEIKGEVFIMDTKFDNKIKQLSQEERRILFEHGIDYMIFKPDGTINDFRLQSLFNDFNI